MNAIADILSDSLAAARPATDPAAGATPQQQQDIDRIAAFYTGRMLDYGYDATIEPDLHRRLAAWAARYYCGHMPRGLAIFGATGTGKTMGARIVSRFFGGKTLSARDIARAYQNSLTQQDPGLFREVCSPDWEQLPKTTRRSRLLLVDDLGSETMIMHYGHKVEACGELITWAYDEWCKHALTLLLTTNLTLSEIQDRYGVRTRSRLSEMTYCIATRGRDRRVSTTTTGAST